VTDLAAREIASREPWERLREQRRQEMLDMLGLDPLPERTPLNVQITGKIDQPEYTIEKIAFESLPKVYVTANLYIPKNREGKLPAVIYVCGHAYSPYGSKTVYQRHPITLAKHGYVAMILDPIQIAETFGLHHGVYNNEMYDWYTRGYTPAGVECWNGIRGIDYLLTRAEVDPGVRTARLSVEETAQTETSGQFPLNGKDKSQIGILRSAPVAFQLLDDSDLAVSASLIFCR